MKLELFPCSGGMAEGFRRAGIRFDVSFDYDEDACSSYAANLGHAPIRMDVRDLVRMARDGWRPDGAVDLLVADPPCTPWSRAGKRRGLNDERDMLTETCELISLLDPSVWVIGNVPGLDDEPNEAARERTVGGLRRRWCVDFARLDAADYGVPQHRVRPFWVGHLHGTRCIRWPEPTHGSLADAAQIRIDRSALHPWVTCREALADLPVEALGRPVRVRARNDSGDCRYHHDSRPARTVTAAKRGSDAMLVERKQSRPGDPCSELDKPGKVVPSSRPGNGGAVLLTHPRHPISSLDEPSYTLTSKGDGRGAQGGNTLAAANYKRSTKGPQSQRVRDASRPSATITAGAARVGSGEAATIAWPWDLPATTLHADERIAPPGHHDESFLSGPNAIVLSERAAMRLQGFPDGWTIAGKTKASRWGQIGMAMPPALAEAVARGIAAMLAGAPAAEVAAE